MSGERIALYECDEPTRELLRDHLMADGFEVITPTHIERWESIDLAILDPDVGDAMLAYQNAKNDAPVIALVRDRERDALRALSRGADDFLTKPFHYQELLARIRIMLRRGRAHSTERKIGDLTIDLVGERVTLEHGEREIALTKREFTLLAALSRDPSRVFSKQELLRDVWGDRSLSRTRTLDSTASRLRLKLASPEGTTRYIVNYWGVGYRLTDN